MRLRVLILGVFLAVCAMNLYAWEDYSALEDPMNQDGADPCPTYDSCTLTRERWTESGQSSWIEVKCKQGSCWNCATNNRCVNTYASGSCSCNDVPQQGAAPGITYCDPQGSCYYAP